jgi:hypothetical protein
VVSRLRGRVRRRNDNNRGYRAANDGAGNNPPGKNGARKSNPSRRYLLFVFLLQIQPVQKVPSICLVYNDAYFGNARALWDEHPDVLAQLLGVRNRPMAEIVTVEEDLGISTMTNRSAEIALVKRQRVDDCGEDVDDSPVRTEQPGGGTATNSSAT